MWITSHTGKGKNPKLLGIIPMAGTKQITLRGAAHSKLRKVMPKKKRAERANEVAQSFEVCSRVCLIRGWHATGLKPNSRQELFLFISSPRLQQNVCFGACDCRKLQKAQEKLPEWQNGFHHSRVAGRVWATAARLICAASLLLLSLIGSHENEIVPFRESGPEPQLPSLLLILRPVTYPLCAYSVYPWQITCMIY